MRPLGEVTTVVVVLVVKTVLSNEPEEVLLGWSDAAVSKC